MGLPELLRAIAGKRRQPARPPVVGPRDPSGIAATGEGQHVLVVEGSDPFTVTARPGLGRTLTWHSYDTSVARLQVSPDTRSALVIPGSLGRALVTASDGEAAQTFVVTVTPREKPSPEPIGLTIQAGVGMGSG
jgi:hypothetical protein